MLLICMALVMVWICGVAITGKIAERIVKDLLVISRKNQIKKRRVR